MKFNHAYMIAFSVVSENSAEHVTERELLAGLSARLADLMKSQHEEITEACGLPYNTYTEEK